MIDNTIRRNLNVRYKIIKDKTFLINKDEVYEIDELSSLIWEYIDGKKTFNDIKQLILGIYDVEERILHEDLLEIIARMKKQRLIL